jgi:hypothetical protein
MQSPPTSEPSHTSSHFLPLALWLGIQLLVLLAAAMQIRLSDQFPRPPERLALDEMLVAQVAMAAMLFPLLLRNAATTALVVAASWPFVQLAGVLSSASPANVFSGGCYVSGWLVVLGLCRPLLRTEKGMMLAVATATAAALGGALMWYVRAEFAFDPSKPSSAAASAMGPIVGALAASHGQAIAISVWGPMAIALAISLTAAVIAWIRRGKTLNKGHAIISTPV